MKHLFAVAAIVVLCTTYSASQASPSVGLPPFASTQQNAVDTVNLGNLNVNFALKAVHVNGRGLPLDFAIGYNSLAWQITGAAPSQSWVPAGNPDATGAPTFGWTRDYPLGKTTYRYTSHWVKCSDGGHALNESWTGYSYKDSFGTDHGFPGVIWNEWGCDGSWGGTFTGYASDNSGIYIDISGDQTAPVITYPSGSKITGTITDTNGNYISSSASSTGTCPGPTCVVTNTLTDTIGNQALIITSSNTSTTYQYLYPDTSTRRTITLAYQSFNIKTNFACSGITEYTGTANLPISLTYPDGQVYSFAYEATPGNSGYYTGRIAQVGLPSGDHINYTYTYQSSHDGINCTDATGTSLQRQTMDGTWTYFRSLVSGSTWLTQVIDPTAAYPNGNWTNVYFQGVGGNFYETQRDIQQGQSTWLESVYTCYNGSASPCYNTPLSLPITRRTVTLYWPNGYKAKTDTFYDSGGLGLTQEVDEYDYGNPNPGALLRKTLTTYASLGNHISNRPATVTTQDGSGATKARTTYSYDEYAVAASGAPQHSSVSGSRGNVTTKSQLTQGSSYLTQHFYYFDTGLVQQSVDPNTSVTTYTYGNCGSAFVSNVALPLGLSQSQAWNCAGGVPTSSTDENGQQTFYYYEDGNTWRLSRTNYPDGGQTSFTYNVSTTPQTLVTTTKIDAGRNLVSTTVLDGRGRVSEQQLNSDPGGTVYINRTYDSLGRVYTVSNPFRIGDPQLVTKYAYDPLGRVTTLTRPDSSTVITSYTGRAISTSDEGNGSRRVQRTAQSDGLGRLVSACEVTSTTLIGITPTPSACGQDIAATGFLTTYQYDALNNLTSVAQGGLSGRSYSYDGLSRLASETNPENGTTTYTYNSNGDLYQRTQPKQNQTNPAVTVTTTYSFDVLHRLTGKSYSDGTTPAVAYVYDASSYWGYSLPNPKGRRVAATTTTTGGVSIGSLVGYDQVGRADLIYQRTPINNGSGAFNIGYTYDYLGDMLTASNGEGVTLTYSYNAAAALTSITSSLSDANHPATLLSGITRNAMGQMTAATLGNGIALSRSYTNRGFLQSLTDGTVYSANPLSYAANGDVLGAADSINGNWTFGYDDFNRLATASKTGDSYSYVYDRFGNRWQQNGGIRQSSLSFDANNHILASNGVTYDAAGNVTNDSFHTYMYDAENRLMSVDGGASTYAYDADGQRVRQATPSGTYDYLYDSRRRVITAVDSANQWARSEIYAGSTHIATYSLGTTFFEHADWLGTVRARTDPTAALVETCTSEWFGDGQSCTGTDASPLHFTGQDLDSESNLSHFPFRYYSSAQGRWITPDPAGRSAVHVGNPQSWNRYVYAMNNPIKRVDPFGLEDCDSGAEGDCGDDGGGGGDGGGGEGGGDGGGGEGDPPVAPPPPDELPPGDPGYCGPWNSACGPGQGNYGSTPDWVLTGHWSDEAAALMWGDPCVYLNNQGNGVESVDHNSSPEECKATGGQWVPPQPPGTTYGVYPNGDVHPILPQACTITDRLKAANKKAVKVFVRDMAVGEGAAFAVGCGIGAPAGAPFGAVVGVVGGCVGGGSAAAGAALPLTTFVSSIDASIEAYSDAFSSDCH